MKRLATKVSFLLTLATLVTTSALMGPAAAQTAWAPRGRITIVVPTSPGGDLDIAARTVQKIMSTQITTPIVVINNSGGGGVSAMEFVHAHAGDGSYIMLGSPAMESGPILGTSPLGLKDFTPVAMLETDQIAFSIPNDSPFKTPQDLFQQLKTNPESVSVGVSGSLGAHNHVAMVLLLEALGGDPKKLKIVVFRSGSEVVTAVAGGHIMLGVTPASSTIGLLQTKTIRVIAIAGEKRLGPPLADVPTIKELGVNMSFSAARALLGPPGMTQAQLDWWNAALAKVTSTPEWHTAAKRYTWEENYQNAKQASASLYVTQDEFAKVLRDVGLAK